MAYKLHTGQTIIYPSNDEYIFINDKVLRKCDGGTVDPKYYSLKEIDSQINSDYFEWPSVVSGNNYYDYNSTPYISVKKRSCNNRKPYGSNLSVVVTSDSSYSLFYKDGKFREPFNLPIPYQVSGGIFYNRYTDEFYVSTTIDNIFFKYTEQQILLSKEPTYLDLTDISSVNADFEGIDFFQNYCVAFKAINSYLYISDDYGKTWSESNPTEFTGTSIRRLAFTPNKELVCITNNGKMFYSTDFLTFTELAEFDLNVGTSSVSYDSSDDTLLIMPDYFVSGTSKGVIRFTKGNPIQVGVSEGEYITFPHTTGDSSMRDIMTNGRGRWCAIPQTTANGKIFYYSDDDGQTWEVNDTYTRGTDTLLGAVISNNNMLFLGGYRDFIFPDSEKLSDIPDKRTVPNKPSKISNYNYYMVV